MNRLKNFCIAVAILASGCREGEMSSSTLALPGGAKPPALAISHDLSVPYRYVPAPNAMLLREWANYVANEGGCVAFSLFGSPDSVGNLIRMSFLRMPRLCKNPTYLDQSLFNQSRDSVLQANAVLVETFVQEVLALLQHCPPQQHTDINGRWREVRIFFEEPGMDRYTHFYFNTSDGWQDVKVPERPIDTLLQPEILPPNVTVLTCGWKNPVHPDGWIRLGTPQALITALKSITSK